MPISAFLLSDMDGVETPAGRREYQLLKLNAAGSAAGVAFAFEAPGNWLRRALADRRRTTEGASVARADVSRG